MSTVAHLEPWLDRAELADHLGCSVRWIRYRQAEGMPHAVIAGRCKFKTSEVTEWLERRATSPEEDHAELPTDDGRATVLYRCFDDAGRLLYVGISWSAPVRFAQHQGSSSWWDEVARIDLEHFSSRLRAAAAEVVAIRAEQPAHNIVHNPVGQP